MGRRVPRLEAQIKDEISLILLHKYAGYGLGFVTLTNVVLTPDLKLAKIYVSVFEKEKRAEVLEKLDMYNKSIRTELASRIRVRYVPELKFYLDDTTDVVERIDELIKQIHKDDNKTEL